jgi:CTP synthase
VDALLVPGGFGNRGIEGKISAIGYARKTGLPFLGLCLGMQCAVIEFAREACGLTDAHSTEFDPDTTNPVIDLLESQIDITDLGGTMRLGSWRCKVQEGSLAHRLYGEVDISERHRHRYELNNTYRELLTGKGLSLSGTTPDGALVELIELPDHPYFIATQGHPEFKSRPNRPHPLFVGLVKAALERK